MGPVARHTTVAGLPWVISPWAVEQIALLDASAYLDHGPGSSGSGATQTHIDVAARGLIAHNRRVPVCCSRQSDSTVTSEGERSFGVAEVVAP